jgi:hypothetical protein
MPGPLIGILGAVAFLAAYFIIGVVLARRRSVAAYRRHLAREQRLFPALAKAKPKELQGTAVVLAREEMKLLATFWPFILLVEGIRALGNGGSNLVMDPVYAQIRQAEKLRADAAEWRRVAQHPEASATERQMAEELAELLTERAKELS